MNTKNNKPKTKIINVGKKNNKESEKRKIKENSNNQKKVIESYNSKNKDIQYMKKKINLETNTTFDKKNNLSLFSFLSSNTNQEEKTTNKSLKTTKETESNQLSLKYTNNNNKKKLFLNSNKINLHKKKEKKKISNSAHNKILLNKELDNFKNRIDNLMKVIEDFEIKYINSTENKKIKDELNKIIKNKKYFEHKDTYSNLGTGTQNFDVKSHQKQIYYRKSNKNILNREENNNKTEKIKNNKFNLLNNPRQKNHFNSTKNIKNKNINNSIITNKKEKNKQNNNKKEINKNTKNSYDKRINYSTLIEFKPKNKEKPKKNIKVNKNDLNKNIINKSKPMTCHYPSKSNDIQAFENICNEKKIKEKEIINNTIYTKPSYKNKTPKIYRVKERINKKENPKSNKNNPNKTKRVIKK